MDQELYRQAEVSALKANADALKVLQPMWDGVLKAVTNAEEGLCRECDKAATDDDRDVCPVCGDEIESYALAALDPLSIEDDGRIILGFGGPNIWISADNAMCGAWWGSTVRCWAPTADHERAIETIREQIAELAGC